MEFIETSTKTAPKVQEAFEILTQKIIKASVSKDQAWQKKIKLFIFLLVLLIFLLNKKEDAVKSI